MTEQMIKDIKDFHDKYCPDLEPKGPIQLSNDLHDFRVKFLQEELDEYIEAHKEGDLAGQFDALIDLVYVALGTAWMQGFPFMKGWDLVQKANMSKVRAEGAKDSKRQSKYDVVKPEGWTAPDIDALINELLKLKETL